MSEVAKNMADPWWRICNLYTIEDEKGKLVPFTPNACQREFYDQIHWLNYVLKSRQLGFSTFIAIFLLDRLLFEPNKRAGVIDYTMTDATKKLRKMRVAYKELNNKELHPETWMIGAAIHARTQMTKGMDSEFPETIVLSNDSMIHAGTSHRGDTLQYVWVSELGKIANKSADKANEILEGAFEAAHEGSIGFIETTHEGGRAGVAYDMCSKAMRETAQAKADRRKLVRLEWRFHFFGWWQDKKNRLKDEETAMVQNDLKLNGYWDRLEQIGIKPDQNQRAWYQLKWKGRETSVLKEHPSTPEDAFQAAIAGSVYGEWITRARADGRVRNYSIEKRAPVYTFWDLGRRDCTVIWFVQFVGLDIRMVDCYQNRHQGMDHYARYCDRWARDNDVLIVQNILPHDGDYKNAARNESCSDVLKASGMRDIRVVPRRKALIWESIDHVRMLMDRMVWRNDALEVRPTFDGKEGPSAIACVEAYHVSENAKGSDPEHDETSHVCDALRTMGEADQQGIIDASGLIKESDFRDHDSSPTRMASTVTGFEEW